MYQTIQIRRGLQANIASATVAVGEILFTTDTGCVYVYDGTAKQLIGRVTSGLLSARPAFGISGRAYFATDKGQMFLDLGTSWQLASVTNLDDVADGETYAKVKKSEVVTGFVKQLNDGANIVGVTDIKSHIDSASIHASLNDSATTSTSLWSSQKTQNAIDGALSGLSWKTPVNSIGLTLPASGVEGQRFLNITDNKIYTYTTSWGTGESPAANWTVMNRDDESGWTYDSDALAWVQFTGTGQITNGAGLNKVGNVLSVKMGAGVAELPAGEVGLDLSASGGLELTSQLTGGQLKIKPNVTTGVTVVPVNIGANGSGVLVDDSTLVNSSGTLIVKDAGIVAAKLASNVAGNGLTQNATTKAIDINLASNSGLQVSSDALLVKPDTTTGVTVSPVVVNANGLGVGVDNVSIVHDSGVLSVDVVDGGTF